jgi:hypothetical protein
VDSNQNIFNSQIKPELVDESRAVTFEMEANQCSLHEARIIHGADANNSPRRRADYTMRYFPLTSKINTEQNANARFWLARGKDIAGNPLENYSP